MDWTKSITRELAVVIVALLAAVCVLVIFGHVDLKDIGVFGTTIIGALVLAQQKAVRESAARAEANTNGVNAGLQKKLEDKDQQMIALQEQHKRELAQAIAQMPAGASLPKTLTEDPPPPINGS